METQINKSSICSLSENIVAREIEGEMIIVPLVAGICDADDELYTLNATGQVIWKMIDGVRPLGEIADILSREYDTPLVDIYSDVIGFVTELTNRGILVVKPATSNESPA